ncbi:MAG: sigma-70 family RNA polymerase sigma factor [Actinomycetota bacterium]
MSRTYDSELWARARAGDAESFGELFDRHNRAIYNYAFRRTGDWSFAEEVVSDTFLETWRRRSDIELLDDTLLPWLYGVATNIVRAQRRRSRRATAAAARLDGQERASLDPADDAAARIDDQRRMHDILGVLDRLPEQDQELLTLCAWQGLTYQQAADALDVPVGTVRSRLSRARARLRELSDPSGHGGDGTVATATVAKGEENDV